MAIILPGGFQITNNEAVDSRISVADQSARLGFSSANVYEGLLVYQQDTNEIYVLTNASDPTNNSNWDLIYPVSGSSVSNSGSFSGSFQGDGSKLTNISTSSFAHTASYLEGFIESASYAATASRALTASYLEGFIESASYATTASYALTASYVPCSISASYALTASYIEMSDAYREDFTNVNSITVTHNIGSSDVIVAVYETTGGSSPQLIIPQSVTLTNDFEAVITFATNITGYVVITDGKGVANVGLVTSASYALTASYALNGSGNSVTASYALTASYLDGLVESSSFALTASYVEMADAYREDFTNVNSITANHNIGSEDVIVAVYETTGGTSPQLIIPQSVTLTNDFTAVIVFATNIDGYVIITDGKGIANVGLVTSASYSLTSSYAVTASHVLGVSNTSYREAVTGTTSYSITHNLDEAYPLVQAYELTTSAQEIPSSIVSTGVNSLDVSFTNNFDGTIVVKK